MQLIADQAQSLEAALTVVLPDVFDDQSCAPIEVFCQAERKATSLYILMALGRIEGDQRFIVPTLICDLNGLMSVRLDA